MEKAQEVGESDMRDMDALKIIQYLHANVLQSQTQYTL